MNKWVETWRICIFPPFFPINKKVCFASGIHMHTACSCCSQEKEMKKVTIEIISVETNNAHFIFWQVKKRIETIKTAAQRIFLQCQLSFNACRYAANSLFRKKNKLEKKFYGWSESPIYGSERLSKSFRSLCFDWIAPSERMNRT